MPNPAITIAMPFYNSAATLELSIRSILNQSYELSAQQVFSQGSQAQAVCYTSHEHRDAVLAFLNKSR